MRSTIATANMTSQDTSYSEDTFMTESIAATLTSITTESLKSKPLVIEGVWPPSSPKNTDSLECDETTQVESDNLESDFITKI